jgi:GNAT superfamily N-acetyltransferase/uncharacterized membrane protein YidH (DUF202 family)
MIMIRKATFEDAPALADLSGQLGYPTSPAALSARIAPILKSQGHAVFVACAENDAVVGWIHAFVALRVESDRFAEIGGLVVAAPYRRSGIGRRLCSAAQDWASQRNLGKLLVRTRIGRTAARPFYESVGFTESKQQHVLEKRL